MHDDLANSPQQNRPEIDPDVPPTVKAALLWSFYRNKLGYTSSLIISVAQGGANLIAPYLFVQMINELDKEEDSNALPWLLGLVGASIISRGFSAWREEILTPIGTQLAHHLAKKVLGTYYSLPMQRFVSATSSPTVNHFAVAHERGSRAYVNTLHGKIIPAVIEMISAGIFLSARFGAAGEIVGGALVVHALSLIIGSRQIVDVQNGYMGNLYAAFDHIVTQIGQYANVNIYNASPQELERFSALLDRLDQSANKNILMKSRALLLQSGVIYSGSVLGVGLLAIYQPEKLSVEDLLWVLIYLAQLSPNFEKLSDSMNTLVAEGQSFAKMIEHLNEVDRFQAASLPPLAVNNTNAAIEFKDICFSYENKAEETITNILQNISFSIPQGKVLVITGESGAGKSSIFNLLQKFYAPTSGAITIAGQDIADRNTVSVRDAFAVVPQFSILQNCSIRENVKYANPQATMQEIDAAINQAGLATALHHHQNEPIGQDGSKLSGGQRQRLALARAYVRKSPILILDEATAALDYATEKSILTELGRLVKEKNTTSIIITHRLAALEFLPNIHEILVLKNGQIVEQGTKAQLMQNKDGIFYKQMLVTQAEQSLAATLDEKSDLKPKYVKMENTGGSSSSSSSGHGLVNEEEEERKRLIRK